MFHRQMVVDSITWQPQLPQMHFRRALEHATVTKVWMNAALVRARANAAITRGTRISIGFGNARGLVAVRRVDPGADATMSDYRVEFLWLDPTLQTFFDDAAPAGSPIHFDWP